MVAGSILVLDKCSFALQQSDGDGVKTLLCSPRYDALLLFLLSISRFGVSALLQMPRTSARWEFLFPIPAVDRNVPFSLLRHVIMKVLRCVHRSGKGLNKDRSILHFVRSKSFLLRWIKGDGEGFVQGWLCNFAAIVEQGGDGRRWCCRRAAIRYLWHETKAVATSSSWARCHCAWAPPAAAHARFPLHW